jgi:hypothetical protein
MFRILFTTVLLIASPIIAGCTTTDAVMSSWVGNDVDNVVRSWGAPTKSITLGNRDVVVEWQWYAEQSQQPCRQTFTADAHGKIISWRYDNCEKYRYYW